MITLGATSFNSRDGGSNMDEVLVTGGVTRLLQRVDVTLDSSLSCPDVRVRRLSSSLQGLYSVTHCPECEST